MNTDCLVNATALFKAKIKHLFSYTLLLYAITNYNKDIDCVILNKRDIIIKFGSNYYTYNGAMEELQKLKILIKKYDYEDGYELNKEFIKVIEHKN